MVLDGGFFDMRSFFHVVSSGLAHIMGLQPTFHPDEAGILVFCDSIETIGVAAVGTSVS